MESRQEIWAFRSILISKCLKIFGLVLFVCIHIVNRKKWVFLEKYANSISKNVRNLLCQFAGHMITHREHNGVNLRRMLHKRARHLVINLRAARDHQVLQVGKTA